MLRELFISNFALIEKQAISFAEGLNVISGETGAGKSIILHAIELLLGSKPRPGILRTGADTLEVQGILELNASAKEILKEFPEINECDELLVSRSIDTSGRSKVTLNGRLSTVSLLREIVSRIINICGQNQHVRLLDPGYHLELVDNFGGHTKDLSEYKNTFEHWQALSEEFLRLQSSQKEVHLRVTQLEEILEEFKGIEIHEVTRQQLEDEIRKLSNIETLIREGQNVLDGLSVEGFDGALQVIGARVGEISKVDANIKALSERFFAARTALAEFEEGLGRYLATLETDNEKLERIQLALHAIARLERKYKTDIVGLRMLLSAAQSELHTLTCPVDLEVKRIALEAVEASLQALAKKLTEKRKKACSSLSKKIAEEFRDLAMAGARVDAEFTTLNLASHGADRLELLISTNAGEPLRQLRLVASGGELARIMLVLKKVLGDKTGVNVLIFDEVDSGISGSVARAVGEKLKNLSKNSQVLCITHLPQVASLADRHFRVDKSETGKRAADVRTVSVVKELDDNQRVEEIARMLAGYQITDASRESARELLSSKA